MMVVGAVTIVVAGGEGRRELAILIVAIVKRKKNMAICFHLQFDKEGHHSVYTWEKKYENRNVCIFVKLLFAFCRSGDEICSSSIQENPTSSCSNRITLSIVTT